MSTIQWTYCSCYYSQKCMKYLHLTYITMFISLYVHSIEHMRLLKLKFTSIFKVTIPRTLLLRYEIPFPRNGLIWLAQMTCQLDGSQVKFKLAFGKISLYSAFYMEYKLKMHSGIALRTKNCMATWIYSIDILFMLIYYPLYAKFARWAV